MQNVQKKENDAEKGHLVWPFLLAISLLISPLVLAYGPYSMFAFDPACDAGINFGLCSPEQVSFTTGPLLIKSTISLNRSGRAVVLARPVPFWEGPVTLDESDLTLRRGDLRFRNVAVLGDTLLPGSSHSSHLPADCGQSEPLSARQQLALHLIKQYAIELPTGALTWTNDFANIFGDLLVESGWNSAYSQAVIAQGLLFAFCKTNDLQYRDMAVQAGRALIMPVSAGGLLNADGGFTFFEEVPAAKGLMPYVLNADIYSINVLYQLADLTEDERFRHAAVEGAASLKTLLPMYDTGSWVRYSLRPAYYDVCVNVPTGSITRIEFIQGQSSYIAAHRTFSNSYCAIVESLRYFAPNAEPLQLRVSFTHEPPKLERQEGLPVEYKEVARGVIEAIWPLSFSSITIGEKSYIDYEAFLLDDLANWTGDSFFRETAMKWRAYLSAR